jgi:hypothetical protein
MSLFERRGITHRISYIELNVDEIGAIYESLLEYIPRISSKTETLESANKKNKHNSQKEISPNTFFLDPRGTSRKTSGSYYTHPGLVNALIESALVPVVEMKIEEVGPNKDNQEKALLSLKICDPACGSAAFLIAATEYLGEKLAKIRIQDEYPNDTQIRHARRDILRHCIYGVDLNPMAVELAKVSLWLTAATNDLPLNFLDHKIKYGNSLIGATSELIKKGIPPEAYSPVEGDDKNIARKRMKIAREYCKRREQEKYQLVFDHVRELERVQAFKVTDLSEKYRENSTQEQKEIEKAYKEHREEYAFIRSKYIADFWTAAFFWKHDDDTKNYPTPMMSDYLLENEIVQLSGELGNRIKEISEEYKFFHWHLEFPEVFKKGGFDCVLGNPPWERIKLQEKEFFAIYSKNISNVSSAYARKELIKKLKIENADLHKRYKSTLRQSECFSKFIRKSNNFILSAHGDINTYPIFAELEIKLLNNFGYSGLICPTGLMTDNTNRIFFKYIVDNQRIVKFVDFINSKGIFPSVDRNQRFSLVILSGNLSKSPSFNCIIGLKEIDDIFLKKKIEITKQDLELFSPNTYTCPLFLSSYDASITKKVYNNCSIFVPEIINKKNNNWNVSFSCTFHMTNDSSLFLNNLKVENKRNYLRLYEAKMIDFYDHRYASVEIPVTGQKLRGKSVKTELKEYCNYQYIVKTRYYVGEDEVQKRIKVKNQKWHIGIRAMAGAVANVRTLCGTILPYCGVGNSILVIEILENKDAILQACLLANLNSYVCDYLLRQKISGTNINQFILKQLPVLPLKTYNSDYEKWIGERVLELVFTAQDVKPFAEDCGYNGEPFLWNEKRRLILKCELDAIYAHLYKLTKDDMNYILETFPIVKKRDIEKYGEYRTKRLILEKYDELKVKFKNL